MSSRVAVQRRLAMLSPWPVGAYAARYSSANLCTCAATSSALFDVRRREGIRGRRTLQPTTQSNAAGRRNSSEVGRRIDHYGFRILNRTTKVMAPSASSQCPRTLSRACSVRVRSIHLSSPRENRPVTHVVILSHPSYHITWPPPGGAPQSPSAARGAAS